MKLGALTELVGRVRRCGTKGDSSLRPYADATVTLERVKIDVLVPLSKYVLEEQLQQVRALRNVLNESGVDLFNLECGIAWPFDEDPRAIAPPVVEQWDEALLLVDGLHRVWTAREQGLSEVTCVVISGVTLPLVPLPSAWTDIKVFAPGQHPEQSEKRTYRFGDRAAVQAVVPELAERVTEENFLYFLFRDLSELGSSGVRVSASEK
jgi:hypothetical protein